MNKYPNPETYLYPLAITQYEYTEKIYEFICGCFNLHSITHETPERDVLAAVCTDMGNLSLRWGLDTFNYLSSWDVLKYGVGTPYEKAFDTIQANIETYIEELVKTAKEKFGQFSDTLKEARYDLEEDGFDEDEIEEELEDEYPHETTWLDHYETISKWDLSKIDFKLLTGWLWGDAIQDWVDDLEDEDEDEE